MTALVRAGTRSVDVTDPRWSGTVHHVRLMRTSQPAWVIEAGFASSRRYTYEITCFAKGRGDRRWEVVHFEVREKAPIPIDQSIERLIDSYIIPYLSRPRSARVYSGALRPLHPFA